MPKGFMISTEQLMSEHHAAKIAGRSEEMADLNLLIYARGENAQVSPEKLAKARNRQAQRRHQHRVSALPCVAPGDRIYDPWNHGVVIVVDSVEKKNGREFWIKGKREIDGIGWTAKRSAVQLAQLARVDGAEPEPAPADLSGPLAASVAIESARSFLAALDGYVAGTADVAEYQAARAALDESLARLSQ